MENIDDDLSYLNVSTEDKQVLKNLSSMGEHLKELKIKFEEAQANLEACKKAYEHYANVVIPQEMFSCGVNSVSLASGGILSIKHNFYCQPNKNAADRKTIVEWLRAHNGGHIVEHDATVSAEDMQKLDADNIPYIENTSVNTQRLKSFLKDGIGVTTGIQQFTIDEIPACMHFQEVTTVDLSI